MAKKSVKKTARKKEFSFGSLHVVNDPPTRLQEAGIKSANLILSFEDALKLHVALQAAVLELNSFDRNTVAGKNKGVNLCYYPETNYITVNRADIPKKYQKKS
jgi:hypothetical protein